MSKDLDALRRQFYDEDPDDPFASLSSSTAAAPAGPSRSRQAQGSRNNVGRTTTASSKTRAGGFSEDALGGLGLGRAPPPALPLGDAMDLDADRDRGYRVGGGDDTGLSAREEAAREIEREEMDAVTGGGAGSDVQRLLRAWQAERHAPVILPAEGELLGRVLDAIRQQVSVLMNNETQPFCLVLIIYCQLYALLGKTCIGKPGVYRAQT